LCEQSVGIFPLKIHQGILSSEPAFEDFGMHAWREQAKKIGGVRSSRSYGAGEIIAVKAVFRERMVGPRRLWHG